MSFLTLREPPSYGSRPYDNVYVAPSNSLQSVSRVVVGQADKISLPSKGFGRNVVTVNLPEARLLGHTTLNFVLARDAVPAQGFLINGWANKAVEYYEYTFANSERLRIDVNSGQMIIKNMADCETGDKKGALQFYAGDPVIANPTPDVPELTGSISLYLPFSNVSASRVHPYPGDILSRPVQITIGFVPFIDVLTYAAVDKPNVEAALSGKEYKEIYVMCKTSFLKDPADSIAELVSIRGNDKYVYPYMYPQTFNASSDVQGIPKSSGNKQSVQLTRFLNGALQSIDLYLERRTLKGTSGTFAMSKSANNPQWYQPMKGCRLIYGGQTIWRSDDYTDKLMNLSEYTSPTTYGVSVPNYDETTSAPASSITIEGKTSEWVHISISLLNESVFTNLAQSGVSLFSNEVLFEFNTDEKESVDMLNSGLTIDTDDDLPMYRLHSVYNYSAAVRVAKSEANLVFQSELESMPAISGLIGTF